MPNSTSNVVVGKPLVTGGVLVAPKGTALPTDALSRLAAAYVATGYITDAGVTKTEKRNTGTVTAWGGDTIAMTKKGFDVTVKVALAEFINATNQALVYGAANVSTLAPTASLLPPVLTLGATAGTGGTWGANIGAKFWTLAAINAIGETIESNEISAVMAAASTQTFTWAAVSGATGYRVYRGNAAGQENVLVASLGVVTTYTDTGTAGTANTYPMAYDSTGRGNQTTVVGTSQPAPHNVWDFEIYNDNNKKVRLVFPDLVVMDIGDTTFKDDSIAALQLTLQAFPDASGNYFYQYSDDGNHL